MRNIGGGEKCCLGKKLNWNFYNFVKILQKENNFWGGENNK